MPLTFEWDEEKARENLRKHKVTHEDAKTIYSDPFLMTFPDPDHSDDEERYVNTMRSEMLSTVQIRPHSPRGEFERGGGPPLLGWRKMICVPNMTSPRCQAAFVASTIRPIEPATP